MLLIVLSLVLQIIFFYLDSVADDNYAGADHHNGCRYNDDNSVADNNYAGADHHNGCRDDNDNSSRDHDYRTSYHYDCCRNDDWFVYKMLAFYTIILLSFINVFSGMYQTFLYYFIYFTALH